LHDGGYLRCPISETVVYNANGPTLASSITTGTCTAPTATTFSCLNSNSGSAVVSGGTVSYVIAGDTGVVAITGCTYTVGATTTSCGTPPVVGSTVGTCTVSAITTAATTASMTVSCAAGQTVVLSTLVTLTGTCATACLPGTEVTTVTNTGTVPAPTSFVYTFSTTAATTTTQPTGEQKTCSNTTTGTTGLQQVIGGATTFSTTGPATSFTIPLFGGASTCAIQLTRIIAGVATPCNLTTVLCADGNVVITLTSLGGGGVISCAPTSAVPTGQTALPVVTSGTCQQQAISTQLNIGCGTTANTAAASTTASSTCTGVLFDIQAALGACMTTPTLCGLSGGNANFANTTATVTVQFLATPANGGTVGGIQLGTNTFSFLAPGIGLLLVSATPQLIPSNGTVASVVSATFACGGTGFNLVNGFPLSGAFGTGTTAAGTTTIVNQPILGTGQNAVCGAGLAGNFQFSSPGPIVFDNGRSTEGVSCGVGGSVSPFGNGAFNVNGFNPFGNTGSTFPLVFTCTGAAVLAIGAGVAGDAPVNVVYTSAFGGLQAVGSTLITVSPSGIPRIAVSCNPSTIAAGSTGSICTATVTDINGSPLNGMTGATVTWTTSDPSNASILPCVVAIPGNINITTYPNIAPQYTAATPCQVPTGQIPGQNTTFLNGQASALLVASPTAHPETVTVTAALGVLIPPSFSCLVAPYVPQGPAFGSIFPGAYTATSGVGLPGVTGCGFGNPVGFGGLSSSLNTGSAGLGIGGVILPNTTSASTTVNIGGPAGILIAGATPTSPLQLLRGCNQIIATSTVGTPVANIAALVSPASAVVSIWRFSNNTKQFQAAFFSDPNAPTDFVVTGGINAAPTLGNVGTTAAPGTAGNQTTETYFICVNQASTITSG